MIKDSALLTAFEHQYLRCENSDYFQRLQMFEEMWKYAVFLQVLPTKNPLEGIETDLRIARILNHV